MSEAVSPCPYCHEPLKRAFTIAPSDGQPEMLVLYCAPLQTRRNDSNDVTASNAQSASRVP